MARNVQNVRKMPSLYGELIDLLSDAERESMEHAPELLCDKVRQRYPHVSIGRPARFFDTVTRLAAPTRPFLIGPTKLCGSPLSSYRKRDWIPRIRNTAEGQDVVEFPHELINYGLTESLLEEVWTQVEKSDVTPLKWSLKGVPNVGFYQELGYFLKRWHKTQRATKIAIGRFYIAIDRNLRVKGSRPDNTYRFIQRVVESNLPRNMQMNYGLQEQEMKSLRSKVEACTQQVEKLTSDHKRMKKELDQTKRALRDITNSKHVAERQRDVLQKQASKLKERHTSKLCDYNRLEAVFEEVEEANVVLSDTLAAVEKELSVLSGATSITVDALKMSFCFTSKSGERIYSPAIRKLYI